MNILKKSIYNIIRNYLKKKFTGNLGKVVEEEDRLVCYVKDRNIPQNRYECVISCFEIKEKYKKLAKAYKLEKSICYVIDGIEVKRKKVRIYGYSNSEVIVRNCKFNWGTSIYVNGKCTLENTYIMDFSLLMISAGDLTIKEMSLNHEMKLAGSNYLILIGAKNKLNITGSKIGEMCDSVKVSINSDNQLNIINSKIEGNEIEVKSSVLETNENTSFKALNHTNIETNEFKKLNIDSPTLVFNGKDISKYGKKIELEKNDNLLTNKRLELLEVLKNIRNNCEKTTDEMTKNYRKNLNNQPVSRILKKQI